MRGKKTKGEKLETREEKKGVETENRLLRLNIIVLHVWTFFFFPLNIPPSAIFNRFIEVLFPFGFSSSFLGLGSFFSSLSFPSFYFFAFVLLSFWRFSILPLKAGVGDGGGKVLYVSLHA